MFSSGSVPPSLFCEGVHTQLWTHSYWYFSCSLLWHQICWALKVIVGGLERWLSAKGTSHQAWWPDFELRDPLGGRRKPIPASCSLTFTLVSGYAHAYTHTTPNDCWQKDTDVGGNVRILSVLRCLVEFSLLGSRQLSETTEKQWREWPLGQPGGHRATATYFPLLKLFLFP